MASIKKYGEKWRVQINERGVRRSRTFKTKAEATQWVKYFENTFFKRSFISPDITLDQLFTEYANKVTALKRGNAAELRKMYSRI